MTKQFPHNPTRGFTLVELLVVISIIGMLAGLLLPAVNAAREAGRRATCISNQSQVALALLGYDNARGNLPPITGTVYTIPAGTHGNDFPLMIGLSWTGYLTPYLEMNVAWSYLSIGNSGPGKIVMRSAPPVLFCRSSDKRAGDRDISYVVNGGYQNGFGTDWNNVTTGRETPQGAYYGFEPNKRQDGPFFDQRSHTDLYPPHWKLCDTTVSIDYISSRDGASNTLVLSEKLENAEWIIDVAPFNYGEESHSFDIDGIFTTWREDHVAFCYPINTHPDLNSCEAVRTQKGPLTDYGGDSTASWKGYDAVPYTGSSDNEKTPLFINQGRTTSFWHPYRTARPSSNHPGVVVAANADRSVRVLNENMSKETFVRLCQTNSGAIIKSSDLN